MKKLVRFQHGQTTAYGLVEGDSVQPIEGDLFGSHKHAGEKLALTSLKLLFPVKPPKIFAVGLNYKSHLGGRPAPGQPEIFYKPITCLQNPGDPVITPAQSQNMHFEGELVVVIGKRCSHVTAAEASAAVLGVTCGNDISERDWQGGPAKDLQWWRAKGADTFGPVGPWVVSDIDYSNLQLTTRVNGEIKQQQYTSDLLFDVPAIISYISTWVVLEQGDIIFTGTPGSTSKVNPGDVMEIEIDGIGILRNPVE